MTDTSSIVSQVRVPRAAWFVLVAVGVGTFMSVLDSSIVNVALPIMRRELGARLEGSPSARLAP